MRISDWSSDVCSSDLWPDERRPPSSTDASRLDPTLEMLRIAQCIVDRSRTRATNLLSTEVGSSAEARVEGATRLSFEKCMVAGKVFTFNILMFRGALAEVLYRSDVQGRPLYQRQCYRSVRCSSALMRPRLRPFTRLRNALRPRLRLWCTR